MDEVEGSLERVTFYNPENGYTVARLRVSGYRDPVTVVGSFPQLAPGAQLRVWGEWKLDSRYGRQLSAQGFEEKLPATAAGLERYLGSGMIKGIGPKLAKRIIAVLGADALEMIDREPERLLEIEGIGRRKLKQIQAAWAENREIRYIMLFLQEHGLSTALGTRVYKTYGAQSLSILQEDPYRLCQDIWGVGFATADAIARRLGLDALAPARARAGLVACLRRQSDQGHCYMSHRELLPAAQKLLAEGNTEAPGLDALNAALQEMNLAGTVIAQRIPMRDGAAVQDGGEELLLYLASLFHSEAGLAGRLAMLLNAPAHFVPEAPEALLARVEARLGIRYEAAQRRAALTAWTKKVCLLTGGPGTGKTFTTKAILEGFEMLGARMLLAAPTGRAARRLSEATGQEAQTLHRLLGYRPDTGWGRGAENPLEADVVLVDEASMIDVVLGYHLVMALPRECRLILVGDSDQLPSVGPGNVLHDLLEAGLPQERLGVVFRQAAQSAIIQNAHLIREGRFPDARAGTRDFFFLRERDPETVAATVIDLCARRLPARYGVNPLEDIQVLSPMQRGVCGARELNGGLQARLNPQGRSLRWGSGSFRIADRVMQLRNNYDKDVYNGDLGRVEELSEEDGWLVVDFDGRQVRYETMELDELAPAYAITVHKSQGSEYPIVVLPLTLQHQIMLQRNLLYTAVTRARKLLILVGDPAALERCLKNADAGKRNTLLTWRLGRQLSTEQEEGKR